MSSIISQDKNAIKYKIAVEIAGVDWQGFNGWFELSQGPILTNQHVVMLSQAAVGEHRLTLSFLNLDNLTYNLWLAVGSTRALNGAYYLPLGAQVKPVAHGMEKLEWDNILVPIVPLTGSDPRDLSSGQPQVLPLGWLYVFVNGYLWRELQIINDLGAMRDVDLSMDGGKDRRPSCGQIQPHVLVPYKINDIVTPVSLYYAVAQLPWSMLCSLGGLAPYDRRFSAKVIEASRKHPVNAALQRDLLQPVDLSSYRQGFKGQSRLVPIDACPRIGTHSQPGSDLLKSFRNTKIPAVFVQI